MKTLFARMEELLVAAALAEQGMRLDTAPAEACDPFKESLEENLMEVAFAEAADFDEIHRAILSEHLRHCPVA